MTEERLSGESGTFNPNSLSSLDEYLISRAYAPIDWVNSTDLIEEGERLEKARIERVRQEVRTFIQWMKENPDLTL